MKIVVRMPNWIGDTVMALPSLNALRANYPDAEIWMAARDWAKDLFTDGLAIKGLVHLPDLRNLRDLRQASSRLKERGFDLGLLLTNSFSSAFLFYAAGIPERWGYARDGRGLLLSRRVPLKSDNNDRHMIDYYLDLISGLGLKRGPSGINLHLAEEEKTAAGKALTQAGYDKSRPLVILNPAAAYGPAKRWPVERFSATARLYQSRKNAEIAVVGSNAELETAEAIASALERKPLIFSGKTSLRELMGLISCSRLFVSNDTGPMHIANALRVPVVAIFGPTDPKVTGPIQGPSVVLKKDVPCWPCFYRACPYDHRCMSAIEPEEVFEAGRNFL